MRLLLTFLLSVLLLSRSLPAASVHLCFDNGSAHLCADECPVTDRECPSQETPGHAENEGHHCCDHALPMLAALDKEGLTISLSVLKTAAIPPAASTFDLKNIFHPPV